MAQTIPGLCVPAQAIVAGVLENNIYIIGGTDPATGTDAEAVVVVDPGCAPDPILAALGGRSLDYIVLTHCHWDHVGGAAALRAATGAQVIAGSIDASVIAGARELSVMHTSFEPCPVDRTVEDGDVLHLGAMEWRVLHTPGHTPGGICLFAAAETGVNPAGRPVLVSGDTLFNGTIGRTDFEGGSMEQMCTSLEKLAQLPDETIVLPGHNGFTSIGAERHRVLEAFSMKKGLL